MSKSVLHVPAVWPGWTFMSSNRNVTLALGVDCIRREFKGISVKVRKKVFEVRFFHHQAILNGTAIPHLYGFIALTNI